MMIMMFQFIILIWFHQIISGIARGIAVDTSPPTITYCPSDIRLSAPSEQFKTKVSFPEPTATDDGGPPNVLRSHRPNDTYFYAGKTDVTYWFIDSANNVARCTFDVTIDSTVSYDVTPPWLKCPAEEKAYVEQGLDSVRVYYHFDYTDNNSDGELYIYEYPPRGSLFYRGINHVWVIVQDSVGNTNYCTFKVIVSESENVCEPNPCPNGDECYRNTLNTGYRCGTTEPDTPPPTQVSTAGCDNLGKIENGYVIPHTNGPYSYGSTVEFACKSGYMLEGATESICLNDKTWSSDTPKCVQADVSAQSTACQTSYGTIIGAAVGSIIGLLEIEAIIFGVWWYTRFRNKQPISKPEQPRPASVNQSYGMGQTVATNAGSQLPPAVVHTYMSIRDNQSSLPSSQVDDDGYLSPSPHNDDGYVTPNPPYIEVTT